MLENENIICLSVTDYGHDLPVGKDHLMEIYSKNNKVIVFNLVGSRAPQATKYDLCKIVRKIRDWISKSRKINKIDVINPIRLPFIQYKIVNKINDFILFIYFNYYFNKYKIREPIFWVLNVLYADLLKRLKKKLLIYYVSDEYSLFSGNKRDVFKKYENKMLLFSDGVITVHKKLYNDKLRYNENTIHIFNGTNPKHFILKDDFRIPDELQNLSRPIVGFSGKIEDWIDLELLRDAALSYPNYSFVIIGPIKISVNIIDNMKNIFMLGVKDYSILPNYLNSIDIFILPFVKSDRMNTIDIPLSLMEYLAVGKPIVSININKIEEYSDVYTITNSKEEFIKEIGQALKNDNELLRNRRREIALNNSWEEKAEYLSKWIKYTLLDIY